MKNISITKQFKRDAKKYYLSLLTPSWTEVLSCLLNDKPLPEKYKDHKLTGNLKDLRDCHIKPDLVLLYRLCESEIELIRLGSHSEIGIS
ncbi:type II toxin-antitoxin system YafQ family toxin [Pasteurella skyensis]|uniref:Type II toxin-antitoxin system YafQ family toxin n=1 Tax=Phocoenobacter skyensis TaxID=97481 RepID=A0AAJ6P060_9PAST|nr:type II toxin-antitoxin system YafQ family toxin [Pasteurella skyensis]MDP8162077.1 type II toxin-antitoxin system YafQ family toxin [Pasteurella skyensis]MDP8172233.1 type II toxin-antitoxin system YafQ family toxin [Pasteurella skyensis]MDP8176418.1 type II toxin-antitoxin system YafQ family toxin [Pasteurella skyensis]MDP8178307.1 type II toxin-antitoxin system YafQ family toxin [Pasteurella skyensis]MDP8182937.1 type II toxin-antitoxin system YafQ family toxin [Pasteurella skyensis]